MIPRLRFLTTFAFALVPCLSSIAQFDPGYLRRASTGDATAMHLIGRAAAAEGKSVEAYAWFSLASEYGVETSEKAALFSSLSTAQVASAAKRVEEIKSRELQGLPRPAPKGGTRVVVAKPSETENRVAPPEIAMVEIQSASDARSEAHKAQISRLEADLAAARSEVRDARKQSGENSASLEAALAKASQERDALAGEIGALRRDKQSLEESLAQMRAQPSLEGQVQSQKAQIAKLETDLAAAQYGASEAKVRSDEEIAALRRDKQRAEETLAQMRAQPSWEGEVQAQKARIARLEADLAGVRQERKGAEEARDQVRAELSAARSRLEADLDAARSEASTAKAKSAESTGRLEAALSKANSERDALSGEIAALRADKQRAEESLAKLSAQPSFERQVQEQKAQIARLEGSVTALRQERQNAEEARDQLRGELSTVRSRLEADLAAARTEAGAAKEAAEKATAKAEAALAQATQVTQERDALSGKVAALERDKQRAEESLAQLKAQPSFEGQVQTQKTQIARLEADLAAARSEVETAKAASGAAISRLESSLGQTTRERDALAAQLSALRKDKERVDDALAQLRARPSTDSQLEEQKAQIAKLEADLFAARTEARDAKKQSDEAAARLQAALNRPAEDRDAHAKEVAVLKQERLAAEQARDQLRAEFSAARQKLESDLAAVRNEARVASAYAAKLEKDLANARSEARSGGAQFDESMNSLRAVPSRAPAPEPVVVAEPVLPRVHTVTSGETLSSVSQRYYGTPNRWSDIFDANRDVLSSPNQLALGTRLRIP